MTKHSASELDPAIVEGLQIDPARTDVRSGSFSSKISTTTDGQTWHYFLKTSSEEDTANTRSTYWKNIYCWCITDDRLTGEYLALKAMHSIVPSLCPSAVAYGRLRNSPGSFLVIDYLDSGPSSRASEKGSGLSLAQKLARLHQTPAPVPKGQNTAFYGFPVPTFCGPRAQCNSYRRSWKDFFIENRLSSIRDACIANHGPEQQLTSLIDMTIDDVVPKLLDDAHLGGKTGIRPVLVHGDLWSGNHFAARIGGRGGMEEVIFDPSACYAHSEYVSSLSRFSTFIEFGTPTLCSNIRRNPPAKIKHPRDDTDREPR